MLTKQEAYKRAKILLSRMKTKGWKIRIWENLGWHYELINKTVDITDEDRPRCTAMFKPHYSFWEVTHHKNPNLAIRSLLNKALQITLEHLDIIRLGQSILK